MQLHWRSTKEIQHDTENENTIFSNDYAIKATLKELN